MPRLYFAVAALLCALPAFSQNDCGFDFRPIGDHHDLPANSTYTNTKASPEDRAEDVVSRLSFEEKLALTGGVKGFYFPGVARLGIPPVYFADATQGIHEKTGCITVEKSTAFPSGQALAATWNQELATRYAAAIGEETRAWGIGELLGPGLNLYRNSEGGRNFEYFGEDPYLAAKMGVRYIRGMQSTGTVATAKHFVGNEQEFVRHVADVHVDERTLHEIYLSPFESAIQDGGVLAVMTGNNLVNGHPGAADLPLSKGVLRDQLGFKGAIMSDWAQSMYWPTRLNEEIGSGHSLLMAENTGFVNWVHSEIAAHPERKAAIEDALGTMVRQNLYTYFKAGTYDRPNRNLPLVNKIESHAAVAREVGDESITLLKNEGGILPLDPQRVTRIAVVGTDEALNAYGGKGSGAVKGYDHVSFVEGLRAIYGGDKVFVLQNGVLGPLKSATVVLLVINKPAGENFDVPFDIPGLGDEVKMLSEVNPNLVVVFSGGNGFPMPWLGEVKGLVFGYLQGQQRGNALADVISGKVNPSGRLPFTIEKSFSDSPAFEYNKLPDGTYGWSGSREGSMKASKAFGNVEIDYKEGIFMGYRWYDHKKIAVQFPFGFGLSYTTFGFGPVRLSSGVLKDGASLTVTVPVKNTGARAGKEVVQLYVHPVKPGVERAEKELKGFAKVEVGAGETKSVTLSIAPDALRYWDTATHGWKVDRGEYEVWVGSSSAEIAQRVRFRY